MTSTAEQMTLPTKEQIERRAYEIYLERGCEDGQDLADWIQAEKELMAMATIKQPIAAQEPMRVNRKSASSMVV